MTKDNATVGVVVMRVQVPRLHEGHRQLLDYVQSKHTHVLVVLGSSGGFPTNINPLSYEVRKGMLFTEYPNVYVSEIKDHPISPAYWSQELDALIASEFPGRTPILYGSRDSFLDLYTGTHKTQYVASENRISGTDIRNSLKLPNSEDARTALIFNEMRRPPRVYATVDLGIKRGEQGLFIAKRIHQGMVSFMGGFIDPNESAEQAVLREKHEEIPTVTVTEPKYQFSLPIDDPRYRKSRDSILTSFFTATYLSGEASPGDDADMVLWVHRSAIVECVVPWHRPLAIEFVRNW